MTRKVIIIMCLVMLIFFGIKVIKDSADFRADEITGQVLIQEKYANLKRGADDVTERLSELTEEFSKEIQRLVGEWKVTEWSIVHRQYTKENYNPDHDNMIGMVIVINEDGSTFFGEDEYQLTDIFVRDAEWLLGTGIVLGDAEKIGRHTEFQFEAMDVEDWMGNKFSFSIIVGENEQWYVTPCYSDVGGFYSISIR
ncbi:MAG: hypothetical protein IJ405_03185 [Lachnospiraceae bacterium]|nr:hypothetical protein [Lachnospiraceae bacterium]MBQ7781009.1 hypothetical protein [Lachnospiraceae bacterium]